MELWPDGGAEEVPLHRLGDREDALLEGIERRSEFVSLPGSASSFQLQTKPASP